MEIKEITPIPAHEKTITYFVCDTCGKKFIDTSWGKLKQCFICKGHVCRECAIVTDHWYLEPGSFSGDYPDYYCKSCWEKGQPIREAIQRARDEEALLWEQWHNLGQ